MRPIARFATFVMLAALLLGLASCGERDHVHELVKTEGVRPSCLTEGMKEYYTCSICDRLFADASAATEVSREDLVLSTTGHDYSVFKYEKGMEWYECAACGAKNEASYEIFYKKNLAIGDLYEANVNSAEVTAVISDETVIAIASIKANEENGKTIYTVMGLKPGTAVISFVTSEGETVDQHQYTVVGSTTYIGQGGLLLDLSADRYAAIVYRDSTLVTYTIKTTAAVDRLVLSQITDLDQAESFAELMSAERITDREVILEFNKFVLEKDSLSDGFVYDEAQGIRYSASRTVDGDTATWTLKLDLGYTAVEFIKIRSYDDDAAAEQTSYLKLNIRYPVFGGTDEDLMELLKILVKTNSTAPILFKGTSTELEAYAELFKHQFDMLQSEGTVFRDRFANTILYGGTGAEYLAGRYIVLPCTTYDFIHDTSPAKWFEGRVVLCDSPVRKGNTLTFYYPISDELRAVIAYQNGYEIDGEKFPYAKSICDGAAAVISEIIRDGMTDFEKERAIYTWLYEYGKNISINGHAPIPDGLDIAKIEDTAFGVMNGYGGLCMAYSSAFKLLCDLAGLECVTVDLYSLQGGGADSELPPVDHRANIIKLGDEYYFVESYWSWQMTGEDGGIYRFLNMTSEEAAKHYRWAVESAGGPFVCDHSTYLVDIYTGELLNK